jgi:hypothetical protein
MKTLEQIKKEYKSETIDGRDLHRLMKFLPEKDLKAFGIELKEEYIGKHEAEPFTREAVIEQLKGDVEFGFVKALDCRAISSSLMAEVVMMWNWILEEGLEDLDFEKNYAMYGLPIFKATALKYGFPNPIGDDTGSEDKYNEQ